MITIVKFMDMGDMGMLQLNSSHFVPMTLDALGIEWCWCDSHWITDSREAVSSFEPEEAAEEGRWVSSASGKS